MIHASESCAMLIPLALAIFSTLFLSELYHDQAFLKTNLRVDNFFRSCILTVAFDRSEEVKRRF